MGTKSRIFAAATTFMMLTYPLHVVASVKEPTISINSPLMEFVPRPSKQTSIDYGSWDFILLETVLYMGPSTRVRASRPGPQVGTRLTRQHVSPYRMEGNKVLYSLIKNTVEADMAAYAQELIEIGNRVDIPSLSRNEQLAYWINLHNAVLVTTIKSNYPGPGRQPRQIKPIKGSDARLHDAKLIKIGNTELSLRDIRERVVFPNWQNPDIAFAFHLGHLSGPSMSNRAYTSKGLRTQLAGNADEYVNSLRAYHNGKMSTYFYDIAPWYFPNFEADLSAFLKRKMRPEVYSEFQNTGIKGKNKPDETIADMTGGFGVNAGIERFYGNFNSSNGSSKLGGLASSFLIERSRKIEQLREKEWFNIGTVVIEDIETSDETVPEVK